VNYVQIKKYSLMALTRVESIGRVRPLAAEKWGFPGLPGGRWRAVKVQAVEVA